jgi:hypothetical protein
MFFEIFGLVTLAVACLIAFRFGGRDEQLTAIGCIAATLLSRIVSTSYSHMEMSILLVDAGFLVGLLVMALRSDRFWPMYAAAFQFLGLVVHVGSMAETGDFARAYAVGLIFWSYAVMAALMIGTWLEGRSRRALGL